MLINRYSGGGWSANQPVRAVVVARDQFGVGDEAGKPGDDGKIYNIAPLSAGGMGEPETDPQQDEPAAEDYDKASRDGAPPRCFEPLTVVMRPPLQFVG